MQSPDLMMLKVLIFFMSSLQEPPGRPQGHNPTGMVTEDFQLWSMSGESCPEGTIPIRRTTEQDMLRASSFRRFGRKARRHVRRDTNSNGHEVNPQKRNYSGEENPNSFFPFLFLPFFMLCLFFFFLSFLESHSLNQLNNSEESGQTKW